MGLDDIPIEHVACILARLALELFRLQCGADVPGLDLALTDAAELLSNVNKDRSDRVSPGVDGSKDPVQRPTRAHRPRHTKYRPRRQRNGENGCKYKERKR